ncbi:MAG: hypothetical protein WD711_08330 [Dongiaceae bacterium]
MNRIHAERPSANRVVAVFETGTAFFELPVAATLEDLADRLVSLSEWHGDTLISVNIELNQAAQSSIAVRH